MGFVAWLLIMISMIGICGMTFPAFTPLAKKTMQRVRVLNMRASKKMIRESRLETMLYLTDKKYEPVISRYRYWARVLLMFVGTFFAMYFFTSEIALTLSTDNPFGDLNTNNVKLGFGFSLLMAIVACFVPYLMLRLKFMGMKVQAGYDLLDVLKIMQRNIHLAVDTALSRTADELPENNVLKRPVKLLSFSFATYTFEDELKRDAERFVKVVGSTFAVSFASDLIYAYKTGGGMNKSLDSLISAMENQLLNVLKGKSEVNDAIHLGSWINFFSIVVICGGLALSIGWSNYIKLQFQTVQGVVFMGITLSLTLLSFVIGLLLSKPKLDY